jgi:hypothetical protein
MWGKRRRTTIAALLLPCLALSLGLVLLAHGHDASDRLDCLVCHAQRPVCISEPPLPLTLCLVPVGALLSLEVVPPHDGEVSSPSSRGPPVR